MNEPSLEVWTSSILFWTKLKHYRVSSDRRRAFKGNDECVFGTHKQKSCITDKKREKKCLMVRLYLQVVSTSHILMTAEHLGPFAWSLLQGFTWSMWCVWTAGFVLNPPQFPFVVRMGWTREPSSCCFITQTDHDHETISFHLFIVASITTLEYYCLLGDMGDYSKYVWDFFRHKTLSAYRVL